MPDDGAQQNEETVVACALADAASRRRAALTVHALSFAAFVVKNAASSQARSDTFPKYPDLALIENVPITLRKSVRLKIVQSRAQTPLLVNAPKSYLAIMNTTHRDSRLTLVTLKWLMVVGWLAG